MTEFEEQQRQLRAREQAHFARVTRSEQQMRAEVRDAQRAYAEFQDDWGRLYEVAKNELAASTEVHADPQVAATLNSQGIGAAAELVAGRILAKAMALRDQTVRAAEDGHAARVEKSAAELHR